MLNLINNAKSKIINLNQKNKKFILEIIASLKDDILIKVRDNAGHIDENIIESIFDPYFTTKKDGTGLGLYVAKIIVEDKMQGKISVKNIGEDIVEFTLYLPKNKAI